VARKSYRLQVADHGRAKAGDAMERPKSSLLAQLRNTIKPHVPGSGTVLKTKRLDHNLIGKLVDGDVDKPKPVLNPYPHTCVDHMTGPPIPCDACDWAALYGRGGSVKGTNPNGCP